MTFQQHFTECRIIRTYQEALDKIEKLGLSSDEWVTATRVAQKAFIDECIKHNISPVFIGLGR